MRRGAPLWWEVHDVPRLQQSLPAARGGLRQATAAAQEVVVGEGAQRGEVVRRPEEHPLGAAHLQRPFSSRSVPIPCSANSARRRFDRRTRTAGAHQSMPKADRPSAMVYPTSEEGRIGAVPGSGLRASCQSAPATRCPPRSPTCAAAAPTAARPAGAPRTPCAAAARRPALPAVRRGRAAP